MADLQIEHADHGDTGAWFIAEGERRIAELVYKVSGPSTITIVHTEVGPELAKATFDKRPELHDVLAS